MFRDGPWVLNSLAMVWAPGLGSVASCYQTDGVLGSSLLPPTQPPYTHTHTHPARMHALTHTHTPHPASNHSLPCLSLAQPCSFLHTLCPDPACGPDHASPSPSFTNTPEDSQHLRSPIAPCSALPGKGPALWAVGGDRRGSVSSCCGLCDHGPPGYVCLCTELVSVSLCRMWVSCVGVGLFLS